MKRIMPLILFAVIMGLGGCDIPAAGGKTVTFQDQEGRMVRVPRHITRVSGEGGIVYALGQQDKLVDRGIYYGPEGDAMARVDPQLAAKPNLRQGKNTLNYEALLALRPQIYFANTEFHKADKEQMERAGLEVFAIKCENIDESFEAVRLIGRVLGCEDRAQAYLDDCRRLLTLAEDRTGDIPADGSR